MSPEQIALVRSSWKRIAPSREQAAALFLCRLFELDPSIRALFKGNGAEQVQKMTSVVGSIVNNLDNLEQLLPPARDLGRRLANHGMRSGHYATAAIALLWTLEKDMGPDFTVPLREAWTAAYMTLTAVMKDAACSPA